MREHAPSNPAEVAFVVATGRQYFEVVVVAAVAVVAVVVAVVAATV